MLKLKQAKINYVYFPNSQKLYHVEERGGDIFTQLVIITKGFILEH